MAVNYRSDAASADALVQRLRDRGATAHALPGDVSDPDAATGVVDGAVELLGGLDVCVSNAGVEHFGSLEHITPADVERVFGVNTFGQLWVTRAAARNLRDGASLILMSSVSARIAVFEHSLYAASKAAVSALVQNLAPELATRGIRINAVAPGGTATDMSVDAAASYLHPALRDLPPERTRALSSALGRTAHPEEIAAAVAFLATTPPS